MKKLLLSVLCLTLSLSALFLVSGCGNAKPERHSHSFTKEVVADEYKASDATCDKKAEYYYSCECGEKGEETFAYGSPLGHEFTHYVSDNNATYEKDGTKTAHCNRNGCTATDTIPDENSKLESKMTFKTLFVGEKNTDGNVSVYGKVPNAQKTYSFINEVKTEGNVQYIVSLDIYGIKQVATKTIPLTEGDNVVYITEQINGNPKTIYEVTIRRRKIYTVSFNLQGGSAVESQQIEEDSLANEPFTTKTGYSFIGWDYDFSEPVTDNIKITASWKVIVYSITYELNGGILDSTPPKSYTVEDTIVLDTPAKLGYDFIGWSNEGRIDKGSIGNKTFVADWKPIIYNIHYNLDGGTNSENNPATYTIESDAITLVAPTKTGYNFLNWSNDGKIADGSTGDKTFTANWQIITYNISYELNGGILDNTPPKSYTVEDTIALNTPAKLGYDFIGWSNDGKISKGSTGDVTFTAKYELIVYKITYICGSGNNNSSNPTGYTIESETITLKDAYYINADFIKWQNADAQITEIPKGSYGDLTLTAVWNQYDVKLQDDGSTFSVIGLNTSKNDVVIESTYKNKKVTSIGSWAFSHCSGLTSITIPNSVTSIGDSAFDGCNGLANIYITDLTAWCKIVGLGELMQVTSNKNLYLNGKLITDLTIPDGVTSIGDYTFYGCSKLTSITIPGSVTSIGGSAFYFCRGLTSITIPVGVTSIGNSAFYYCSRLTSVTIGNGVTSIGDYAFYGCSKLTSIYITDLTAWCKIVGLGNLMQVTSNKNLYLNGKLITDLTIPVDVTSIGNSAFYGCSKLTSITIPDSVTSICDGAFIRCGGLTSIYITDLTAWCKIVGLGNLMQVTSNKNLYLNGKLITNLTIPDGVTSIGDYTFYGCSKLTSITIPNSVTSIGGYAFNYCSGLTSITFNGTKEQWHAIILSQDWNNGVPASAVHCTDGDISIK